MYIRENKYLQNLGNPFGEFLLSFQAFSKHISVSMVYDVEPLETLNEDLYGDYFSFPNAIKL